jgi:phosphatidylinositol glycan class O
MAFDPLTPEYSNKPASLDDIMTEKQSQRSRKSPVQLAEKIVDEATATINRQKETASNVSRSYWGLVTVALYILLIQAAGIAFFTKGFLLSRPVVEDTSLCAAPPGSISTAAGNTGCWMDRTFDRAVVIIVDALRFDFVVPTEDKDSFHSGQMPFMYQISTEQPQNYSASKD